MKLVAFLICSFAFISVKSQQLHLIEHSNEIDNNFTAKTPSPFTKAPVFYSTNHAKWKLISENAKGKVYESPIDKMRCVVFDFKSNMPVAISSQYENSSLLLQRLNTPNVMLNDPAIPLPLNHK